MDRESTMPVPVTFVPLRAHGLRGRLGFCPAPGRWQLDPSLDGDRMLDEDLLVAVRVQHDGPRRPP